MEIQLSTDFTAQTYDGFTGVHNPCNQEYWDTQTFIKNRDLCQRAGRRPPMKPRLAIETYPNVFGGPPTEAEPPLPPMAKAPPPPTMQSVGFISESESEWGS